MFPALAGISLGVLNSFNVTVEFQGLEVLIALGYVCTAILSVFENRFYTICAQNCEIWKWFRHVWLAGHYIVVAILYSGFLFFIPDQTNLPENVFRRLPCLLRDLYEAPILVIAEDYTYHVIVCMSFIAFYCTEGFIFTGSIIYHSIKQLKTKRMSRRTFQMQKNTFIALIIQMKVPLIMIIVPSLYGWISLLTNYHNQALMNIAVTIGSFHGAFSTVVMIFVHRPYREAISSIFVKQSGRVNVTGLQQRKDIFVVINY